MARSVGYLPVSMSLVFTVITSCGADSLSGGADAYVACFLAKVGKGRGAEVAHPRLNAADEFSKDSGEGAGRFFECFNALCCGLSSCVFLGVTVPGGRAILHGGAASHPPILFIEFPVDFNDLPGASLQPASRLPQRTASARVSALTMSPDLAMRAVGEDRDVLFSSGLSGYVESGHLRDANTGDNPCCADGAGTLADLDRIGSGIGEEVSPLRRW